MPVKAPVKDKKTKSKAKPKTPAKARSRPDPRTEPAAPPVHDNKAIYLGFVEQVLKEISPGHWVACQVRTGVAMA